MSVITNIEDLRQLAEKRVPRMFYDYAYCATHSAIDSAAKRLAAR